MPVEGWRERHGTCRFGSYRPARAEGWLEATCQNPEVGDRYDEQFCARECRAYQARDDRPAPGRSPETDEDTPRRSCSWKPPRPIPE